jgi:multimeric flavodoxin WrbA
MKNICFINGSLRGKEASSLVFLNYINGMLAGTEFNKGNINVRAKVKESYPEDNLNTISHADAIIMVFPLFTYGIPGALMRLLEDFYHYAKGHDYNKAAMVYIVVNCGFPRPEIMSELIRVMKNFCRRMSLNWRFAICMGGGPVAAMTMKAPLLNMKYKKAFSAIVSDIKNSDKGQKGNYFIKPLIPEPILLWYKAQYEKKMKA